MSDYDPMDYNRQVPLSMGDSQAKNAGVELPGPAQEDLPNPGAEPTSPVSPTLALKLEDHLTCLSPGKVSV